MSGPTMHVLAIKEADVEYTKKYNAYMACLEAQIDPPKELCKYFGNETPIPEGMKTHLATDYQQGIGLPNGINKYSAEMQNGFDINLETLLKMGIKKIRVYNSY